MKPLIAIVFLMVCSPFALSVSGSEAVNFVANENHFLYDSETYSAPNVSIEFEDSSYWVIALVSGSNIVTYFPIEVDSGAISSSRATNR
ncbi:MAG: hypothetical protein NUV67_02035, partial [archaeon]|nr:hypothetical protein [archaeon]